MNNRPKVQKIGPALWYHYQELASTQITARELALLSKEPLIVTAAAQSAGRGRLERQWESPPGNLYATLVWNYSGPAYQSLLELAVSTADYLKERYNLPVKLKWPNDIVVREQKLAGLIGELYYSGETPRALLGIGINVNSEPRGEVRYRATAISSLLNRGVDIERFRAEYLAYISAKLPHECRPKLLKERYLALSATIGQNIRFMSSEGEITGQAKTIDDNFGLVVETSAGEVRSFSSGDCRHLTKM